AVFGQVVACSLKEELVTELAAEGMEDERSFYVRVAIEHRPRTLIDMGDQRALVAAAVLKVISCVDLGPVVVLVLAPPVLDVEHLAEEDGEAFVEPEVAPVPTRDEVAEPLMGELVGDYGRSGSESFPSLGQHRCAEQSGGHPLHAASVVVHHTL